MALPTTTPLSGVLAAIQSQVAAQTTIPANRILFIKRKTPLFQGDQDILIRVGDPQPEPNMDSAAGRVFPLVYRVLEFTIRSRLGVDLSDRADSWTTDGTNGHYLFEEGLVAALDNFQPIDGNSNVLLEEPMHWLPSSGQQDETPRDQTWGQTVLRFSILYQLPMSPTI